ncbi:MAG: YeeE/YedE family protein [Burkholderiaceae bacterium]|nr:YeeE/YedE family protein [Burkholderiaceae bacterium]
MIKKIGFSLAAGMLFATGLVVSGMTQPSKVIGFLNFGGIFAPARFGAWDASLAFVMGGAVMVTLFAFATTPRDGRKPWAATHFEIPTRQDIDFKLFAGAALFGIGWGLSGYCPGPALASLISGGLDALVFVAALLVGLLTAKRLLV